jgi:hypothetical protein
MTIYEASGTLTWAHIGDLHITAEQRHLLGTRLGPNRNARQW